MCVFCILCVQLVDEEAVGTVVDVLFSPGIRTMAGGPLITKDYCVWPVPAASCLPAP